MRTALGIFILAGVIVFLGDITDGITAAYRKITGRRPQMRGWVPGHEAGPLSEPERALLDEIAEHYGETAADPQKAPRRRP